MGLHRVSYAVGWTAWLDIAPDGVNKATALERVRERGFRLRRSAIESHVEALEELAPPSVLVDEHWNIEHLSESAGRYL